MNHIMFSKTEKNDTVFYIFALSSKTGLAKDSWILMSASAFDLLWQHMSAFGRLLYTHEKRVRVKRANYVLRAQGHENSFDLMDLLKQLLLLQRSLDHISKTIDVG